MISSVVLCSHCFKPTKNCRDWAFSNSGLEVGLPAFQLPIFENVRHCWKEIYGTCLLQESMPFVKSKPPLPTAFWLHHAHPFFAAAERRPVLCREAEGWVAQLWYPRFVWNTLIVLSVVLWDCCKPMNTCRDWASSHSGLEVGLPAFQLPMFAKCEALPKRDLWDMLVGFRHSFQLFFLAKTFNSWRDQRVGNGELLSWESQSSSNVRVDVWVVNLWWIRMICRRKFSVPKFGALARSKQLILMPVTVKSWFDHLVCGLRGHL